MTRIRPLLAFVAVATALTFLAADADARAGRGGSFGSRGANTYSAPPTTRTAPNQAAPIERSMTQPGQQAPGVARPGAPAPAAPVLPAAADFSAVLPDAAAFSAACSAPD